MGKHDIFELTDILFAYAMVSSDSVLLDIESYYNPGAGWTMESMKNNQYYDYVNAQNFKMIWGKVKYVLDNRWDRMG